MVCEGVGYVEGAAASAEGAAELDGEQRWREGDEFGGGVGAVGAVVELDCPLDEGFQIRVRWQHATAVSLSRQTRASKFQVPLGFPAAAPH